MADSLAATVPAPTRRRAVRRLLGGFLFFVLIAGPVEAFLAFTSDFSIFEASIVATIIAFAVLVGLVVLRQSGDARIVAARRRLAATRHWFRRTFRRLIEPLVGVLFAACATALFYGFRVDVPEIAYAGLEPIFWFSGWLLIREIESRDPGEIYIRLHSLMALAEGPAKEPLTGLVDAQLEKLEDQIRGVLSPVGLDLDRAQVTTLTELCFERGNHAYEGADGNVPSEFAERYPTYLESHSKLQTKLLRNVGPLEAVMNALGARSSYGRRFMLVSAEDLRSDKINNPREYSAYVEWHGRNRVDLLGVTPASARAAKAAAIGICLDELPDNGKRRWSAESREQLMRSLNGLALDVALWSDQYALIFDTSTESGDLINVKMRLPGSAEFRYCELYLAELRAEGRCYDVSEEVPLFPKAMADVWADYVHEDRRLNGDPTFDYRGLAPVLDRVLAGHAGGRVLDAAAGIGTDSLWMIRQQIDVTANEIEPSFAELLKQNFAAQGIDEPQLVRIDWRRLTDIYRGEWFEVILVLGNSLCLVRHADDRRRCLQQFYSILKPGGTLVVDERNWGYMLREREHILVDPIRNFRYPRVVYTGTEVRSCPVEISEDEVVLEFYEAPHTSRNAAAEPRIIGRIETYPILEPSLPTLLAEAGFSEIVTLADLEEGETRDDATFFTYVARKPEPEH